MKQLLSYSKPASQLPQEIPAEATLQANDATSIIPVLRPKLPSGKEILPYLEQIDERRWYSNHGPLVVQLERQLDRFLGSDHPIIVTTANATAGITAALLARRVPVGSYCLMPSWTFAATPHAALAAGMTPWFHDVERGTWALDPDRVRETIAHIPHRVGAVVVVSPFGAPLDIGAWEAFEERTGICVVVDAAAGFDTVQASRIPSVVSLHATKILGAGEGGFIVTTDPDLLYRLGACCNFGFWGSRSAMLPALNAKMSEYHAAVALASLKHWAFSRLQQSWIVESYRRGIASLSGVTLQPGYGSGWVGCTTSVVLLPGSREQISHDLLRSGIETRAWWGAGCHVQPAFADCPRGALPVTEDLGARVLGLPQFPDMREQDVDAVVVAVSRAISSRHRYTDRGSA